MLQSEKKYEYPADLYCIACDEDVDVEIDTRIEKLVCDGRNIDAPYDVAVCPKCGKVLCERDRGFAVIRAASVTEQKHDNH